MKAPKRRPSHDFTSPFAGERCIGAGLVASATLAKLTIAQAKVSKTNAKYQDQPKGQQRCDICINFQRRTPAS